jgi:hypothetical protein
MHEDQRNEAIKNSTQPDLEANQAQPLTPEQEEAKAINESQATPTTEPVAQEEVKAPNKNLEEYREVQKLIKTISGKHFCDIIRTTCFAACGASQSHAYGGMSTVGWSIDSDHFIEYSHKDHRAIISKHWKIQEILEEETYSTVEFMKFLREYVLDLKYFRI